MLMTADDYHALPDDEQAEILAWFARVIPDHYCLTAQAEDDAVVLRCVPRDPTALDAVPVDDDGELVATSIAFPHDTVPEPLRRRVFC